MKSKTSGVTCEDCYFRRAQLCALDLDEPCPTFRHHKRGTLAPPLQPRLVPRPLAQVVAHDAAGAPA
ncbi:MAG: hypothetical protein C4305_09505 [Thermoleophilia bacterium]